MPKQSPHELTVAQAARLIRQRKLSPRELTAAYLARIERLNPRLNAYLTVTADHAQRQAAAAEQRAVDGKLRGPLDGIPLGYKDLLDTKGIRTTVGSKILRDNVPSHDAFVVERLHNAGAVMLGKLHMHEFAFGVTNVSANYPSARNPWDTERMTGGSSGGSGAAVAGGLAIATLGSDTGGSIRIPAAMCGTVGIKPTFGRVSKHGAFPLSWSLDHVGPMTRTVEDAGILLNAIAGHDAHDPTSANTPVPNFLRGVRNGVKGLRVGVLPINPAHVEPEVAKAFAGAQYTFSMLGATVEEVTIPTLSDAAIANTTILMAEASALHKQWLDDRAADYAPDVFYRLAAGRMLPATSYLAAQRVRAAVRKELADLFMKVDVLLWPSVPLIAPNIEPLGAIPSKAHRDARVRISPYTPLANLAGLPALAVPCGFSEDGLPIGMQVIAAPWQEALLLRAGYAYEQATEWHTRRPALS